MEDILEISPIRERWKQALDGGFVVVPTVLLHYQAELGLESEEVVVLLNLLSHWWEDDRLPFPRSETLAKRMGIARRTVQRRVRTLEEKGFLTRKWLVRDGDESERKVAHYELTATVERLQQYGVHAGELREARLRLRNRDASAGDSRIGKRGYEQYL